MIQSGPVRILCVADVRGKLKKFHHICEDADTVKGDLRSLNDLARTANATHILHTGDFGFYDQSSLERIAEK